MKALYKCTPFSNRLIQTIPNQKFVSIFAMKVYKDGQPDSSPKAKSKYFNDTPGGLL